MIIPSSVTKIGDSFISECCNLKNIIIPDVPNIGKLYLQNFSLLTEFKIPSTVTRIYEKAFIDCQNLQIIEIPSSVNFIEQYAFSGCSSLIEVTIPPLVKSIENCTFQDCSSLKSVNIQGLITLIGFKAFYKCTSLVYITIPSSIKQIGFNAFQECKSLENIKIPSIGKNFKNIEIMLKFPESFHIILLGDSCVGKTCIIHKFIDKIFRNDFGATIGVGFKSKMIKIQGNDVKLIIWDTSGIERFHDTVRPYCRNKNAAVIVFDLSDPISFYNVKKYFEDVQELNDNQVATILLGNKSDLAHKVSDDDIKAIESQYNTKYFEYSAKCDSNIDDIFHYLANEVANYLLSYKDVLLNLINNDASDQTEKKCNIY